MKNNLNNDKDSFNNMTYKLSAYIFIILIACIAILSVYRLILMFI